MESSCRYWIALVDRFNGVIGRGISWGLLAMVVVTFLVVVLRYFFQLGWVWMQDIVLYLHAAVFLLASPFTLQKDGHVRVDIFYRKAPSQTQAWVNLLGAFFLLIPPCALILYQSTPFVLDSWRVLEGSKDGGGLEAVFLLKTLIPIFALLFALQGSSMAARAYLQLRESKNG